MDRVPARSRTRPAHEPASAKTRTRPWRATFSGVGADTPERPAPHSPPAPSSQRRPRSVPAMASRDPSGTWPLLVGSCHSARAVPLRSANSPSDSPRRVPRSCLGWVARPSSTHGQIRRDCHRGRTTGPARWCTSPPARPDAGVDHAAACAVAGDAPGASWSPPPRPPATLQRQSPPRPLPASSQPWE